METREIRLKGGPYDNAVRATSGTDFTFTIDGHRYVETQETDDAGRRIFKYKPREVSKTVVN